VCPAPALPPFRFLSTPLRDSAFSSLPSLTHTPSNTSSYTRIISEMAEPVGITLGAVSLAGAVSGTFVSIVDCFE